jgi:hypothetical protein
MSPILVNDKSMLVNLPQSPPATEAVAALLLTENEADRCRPLKVMGAGGGRLGEVPVGGENKYAKSLPPIPLLLEVVGAEEV